MLVIAAEAAWSRRQDQRKNRCEGPKMATVPQASD
jgi:hypothetical protein